MKFHAILTTLSPWVFYVVDYTERPRLKVVVLFSGCRCVEGKGFQELKNTKGRENFHLGIKSAVQNILNRPT